MKIDISEPTTPESIAAANRLAPIFNAIVREREFQDDKYGPVILPRPTVKELEDILACRPDGRKNGGHELGAWLIILEKELDEAKDALVHGGGKTAKGRNSIRSELIQLAAVAVAALEQHGLEEA